MTDCRELESLFATYVDGEAPAGDCAAIDAHLRECPSCRGRIAEERVVREALISCRDSFRCAAPVSLRRRCSAERPEAPGTSAPRTGGWTRAWTRWVPLSMAATILLAVAGVFLYGLRGGAGALAAQLAADHVKCFEFAPLPTVRPDGRTLGREWAAARGWELKVPESTTAEELELVGLRRCISTQGLTAHVMYRWRGQPLSVYVLRNARSSVGPVPRLVERFGQEAIMWSKNDRTYAVVAKGRRSEVEHVARYVQTTAE
jgi:anti-sigma factor RsiW